MCNIEVICPIIVSAEFLKRARKKFLKATDRTLRATVIVSQLGLAGGPPPHSPKEFSASGPGISTGFRPEQANQQIEEEKVTAEITRIFESRDLAAVERKISPDSFAWLTSASRYLSLSVEQAMGLFREAFEKRQPQCLAFRVSGEGENKKISVLMKDFGVIKWNGELSAASFISLTPYRGNWFISSIGEFPKDTLENVQRNSTDLRSCPPRAPESQEQKVFSNVSAFGLSAEFTRKGTVLLLMPGDKLQEINLPPVGELYGGGMAFSPDGTKLAVSRGDFRKGNVLYEAFLISVPGGEFSPIFPDFMRSLKQTPLLANFMWSSDSKRLAIGAGQHGGGGTVGLDIETGQILFERSGSLFGEFSPDGQLFARIIGKDLEIINSDGVTEVIIKNNGELFSWSPDSRRLVLHRCLGWDESSPWGPVCRESRLSLYDLQKKELRIFDYSEAFVRPIFSPSGEKILFRQRTNTRLTHFSIFNIRDGTSRLIDLTPVGDTGIAFNGDWSWKFHTESKILGYGKRYQDLRLHMLWIDATDGSLITRQWISYGMNDFASFLGLFEKHLLYSMDRGRMDRKVYLAPINTRNGSIEGIQVGSLPPIPNILVGGGKIYGVLGDSERFGASGQNFLFKDGKKYLIEHEESAEYFGGQKGSIPEGLTSFIPEGEKLSFLSGDVIGNKDGLWSLRGGWRYRIPNWDWFRERQRFTKVPIPIDKGIIEMIPVGEVPPPEPGTRGIRDWDGKMKEHQPFGGRMAIFMGGFDSDSESQLEAFRVMKNFFMSKGVYDVRFLEPSYNLRVTREGTFPEKYASIDTHKHPLDSVKYMDLQIQRYKKMFPMTKFILIGHSLGGFVLFNAAAAHADAVEAVISLDGPLAGVDGSLLDRLTGTGDEIVARWAEVFKNSIVGRFLVEAGDNPAFREEAERKARYLISRGTKVITATNRDDILIPEWSAVLESSRTEAEKGGVQLVWDLGRGHLSFNLGELLFEAGHGQILTDEGVWESFIAGLSLP